jgi:hypothetical protein
MLARITPSAAKRSIGTLMLFTGLSSTVFWPVTSLLVGAVGWRETSLLFAALHLFVCLPIHWTLPRASASARLSIGATPPSPAKETALPWPPVPQHNRWKAFYLMVAVFSLQGFVSWGLPLHLISLFEAYGLTRPTAVFIAALAGPAAVTARLVDMAIGNRLHPVIIASAAMILMPWTFVLLLAATGGSAISATIFTMLWSAANGVMAVARATLPLILFGGSEFGRISGWLSLPQNIVFATAPLAFSLVMENSGTSGTPIMGLVCSMLSLGGLRLLARVARARDT